MKKSAPMKNWNIRMPEHLADAIAKTAQQHKTNTSAFVRDLISEAIQKNGH